MVPLTVSAEEVLSYGVRKRYAANKQLSSSAKILADLGRKFPVAAATFDKCYGAKVSLFLSPSHSISLSPLLLDRSHLGGFLTLASVSHYNG